MKQFVGSLVAVVVFAALPLAAQARDEDKAKDKAKAPAPPRAVYQHTTSAGRLGKFELNGERGKADYFFNGQHHQDDLTFVRSAEMAGGPTGEVMPGWVYQVAGKDKDKDKKESLWFFFAATPLGRGGDQYAMYYSTTPPNKDGKQPWMRILTPGGTHRTPLGQKTKGAEEIAK